jgi:DNA-binding MarR family transcriptional regulator
VLKETILPPAESTSRTAHFQDLLQIQFHLVSRLSERRAEKDVWQAFGLHLRETRIIGIVGSQGSLPFGFLTTRGHFEKGHASRLVAALARKGLVRNEINPQDQRANVLRLTPKGEDLYTQILAFARKTNQRWSAGLSMVQRQALREALDALMKSLCEAEESGKATQAGAARRPRAARPRPMAP